MGELYFVETANQIVFTYSLRDEVVNGRASWRFSRFAPCQKTKLVWVLRWASAAETGGGEGWVVQDQSPGGKQVFMGWPYPETVSEEGSDGPPLGKWRLSNRGHVLMDGPPAYPPLKSLPIVMEAPFATLRYTEDGNVGFLEAEMKSAVITDEPLEEALQKAQQVVQNLARRSGMVLIVRANAQNAAVPAFRHVRRFLDFVKDNGPELFLTGRGSAIILRPHGLLGHTVLGIIKMVQRMLPPPWPEVIVPTEKDAAAFLAEHSAPYRLPAPQAGGAVDSCPGRVSPNEAAPNNRTAIQSI